MLLGLKCDPGILCESYCWRFGDPQRGAGLLEIGFLHCIVTNIQHLSTITTVFFFLTQTLQPLVHSDHPTVLEQGLHRGAGGGGRFNRTAPSDVAYH